MQHPNKDSTQSSHVPAVSVVTPCYNVAPFIAEAIESVFAQTFTDYEVILVNDGSPDSEQFYEAIAPFRHRVTVIDQPNTGPSGARNTGIQAARGEFVAFMDGDDVWRPRFLEKQVARLRSSPEIGVVYSDCELFGTPEVEGQTLMKYCPSTGEPDIFAILKETCTVFTPVTVVRRTALEAVGGFDPTMRYSEDFHLWLRMALAGIQFAYTTEVLGNHRVRSGSQSTNRVPHYQHVVRAVDHVIACANSPELRQAAIQRRAEVWQDLRMCEAKAALQKRDFAAASAAFTDLAPLSWKARLTSAGLRQSPQLVYFGWQVWKKLLRVS